MRNNKNPFFWISQQIILFFKEVHGMAYHIFDLRAKPGPRISLFLSLILFLLGINLYVGKSHKRNEENKMDKIMPTPSRMWESFRRAVFEIEIKEEYDENGDIVENDNPKSYAEAKQRDKDAFRMGEFSSRIDMWRNGYRKQVLSKGESMLLKDTLASGKRFVIAMLFVIFGGVTLGLFMGSFSYAEKFLYRFILFFDKIPTLAILPILLMIFGMEDKSKIALIIMGVAPTIILDTFLRVRDVPDEQIVKSMTLKSSTLETIFFVIYPQIIPKVMDTIRLNFKAAVLFLIAAEALGAESGLGYRIFLVIRYLNMALIIPYVVWISLLAFLLDWSFRMWIKKLGSNKIK